MKKNRKTQHKFHEPFSPAILETEVSSKFVNIINSIGDDVLSDDVKSAKWDWSHKLVGKVSKEIQIPVSDNDDKMTTMLPTVGNAIAIPCCVNIHV